jgi:hypothetical protein
MKKYPPASLCIQTLWIQHFPPTLLTMGANLEVWPGAFLVLGGEGRQGHLFVLMGGGGKGGGILSPKKI